MRIATIGKPGSGKGTQAEVLARKLRVPAISLGEILRKRSLKNDKTGKYIRSRIDKGSFISDRLAFKILSERLEKKDCKKGYILDGFPRNLAQAKMAKDIGTAIEIKVPDSLIIRRISNRRECPKCCRTYNMLTQKPKKDEICDKCKTRLGRRKDDSPNFVKKRLAIYRKKTAPLIAYYRKQGKLVSVDGAGTVSVVFSRIMRALK